MKKYKDYGPETRSLIDRLVKNGYIIVSGNNGGDEDFLGPKEGDTEDEIDDFLDELCAADSAVLTVVGSPDLDEEESGKLRELFLVFGNSPGELVADRASSLLLDKVTNEHFDEWDDTEQRMIWK